MRIDVSEIKEFRNCKRKWMYSSRNAYHLTPVENPRAFAFGTCFHECLHKLYSGTQLTDVYDYIEHELTDEIEKKMMYNMIEGYYSLVLEDMDNYEVLDIERGWQVDILGDIQLCGSIDMIVLDKRDNCIYGFEHKSTARFKESIIVKLDEQLRVYYMALQFITNEINGINKSNFKVGGIILNEVRKLQKKFEYQRTICTYTDSDMEKFMQGICRVASQLLDEVQASIMPDPEPSPMKCVMCQFSSICEHFGYSEITAGDIIDQLPEYVVRSKDHLDAKKAQYGGEE